MRYRLGFSPCPNDTFIFDALVHGKVDTEGLAWEVFMEDVEALNQRARLGELDVTKLSYHAFAHVVSRYQLLTAGSALGNACGPLLVARHPMTDQEIEQADLLIPGAFTTANLLLSLAFPKARRKREVLFSKIEEGVVVGAADAGLLIHESRFTYEANGLVKLCDLGEWWETNTGLPIPLGGIAVRRDIPDSDKQKLNRVLRRSVEYAFANQVAVMPFVRAHAQTMEESVMKAHIALYVNHFTLNLGAEGRAAVQCLFDTAVSKNILAEKFENLFVEG
jgi:1,4-dihydroxy-6-naphthoate synthase